MALPLSDGRLSVGRWSCDLDALEPFHQLPEATFRAQLWNEWEQVTDAVRDAVGRVPAVWLGGSYFTTKEQPGDIDCVYLLDREDLQAARQDSTTAAFVWLLARSGIKAQFGLRVDTYVVPWWPQSGTGRGTDVRREQYLEARGYWDDLWLRDRRAASARGQQVPSKGYLEVVLDGYA